MTKLRFLLWLLIIGILPVVAPVNPAMAEVAGITNFSNRICSLAGHAKARPADIMEMRAAFDCGSDKLAKNTDMLWMVADIGDLQKDMAEPVMRFRAARQGVVMLHNVYPDGSTQTKLYDQADMTARWRSPYAVALPLVSRDGQFPETVLIGAANPWDPSNWNDIELIDAEDDLALHERGALVSVFVLGLLLAPLLLDFVFFIVMRQRFIFYHSLMVVAILVNHICWSGQIFSLFPSATLVQRSWIAFIALAALAFGGCMLIRSLCDPGKLGKWGAFSLKFAAWSTLVTTTIIMIFAEQLSLTGSLIFHAVYGSMAIIAIGNLLRCALMGDRMAMVQLLGLSGAGFIALCRVVRALGWIDDLPIFDFGFYIAILAEALATSMVVGYRAMQMRRERDDAISAKEELEDFAYTDELTGLPNRRAFSIAYSQFAASSSGSDQKSGLAIIDIDNFKNVNDRYGHDVGDQVLIQVAAIMNRRCGRGDHLARFGGEEFVLLTSAQTADRLVHFAQALVDSCAAHDFGDAQHDIGPVTISIGLHFLDNENTVDLQTSFRLADKALYDAKKSGRNQLRFASPRKPDQIAA
jgi:diguanylate cyclase (GGDEF)-like protein